MNNFAASLQNYGLFTFQKRLLDRFLLFTHSIINNDKSPPDLKKAINLPDCSTDDHEPDNFVMNNNLLPTFHFRSGPKTKNIIPDTKYEHLTFQYFFPRLISKLQSKIDFALEKELFKVRIT